MTHTRRVLIAAVVCLLEGLQVAAQDGTSAALARGIEQLRYMHGDWSVTTEFLRPDGSVARSAEGTYSYRWVVPDRVLSGESRIPSLSQASGFLLYVNEAKSIVEMSSVGADGHLWVMTGPMDGEVRTTPPTLRSDGTTVQLRFTRFNVTPDTFESRMESSRDEGRTWSPGNHQLFRRQEK